MHSFSLPESEVALITARRGKPHICGAITPASAALLVIDMQNYFLEPGLQGEVPAARAIVPNINRLAEGFRESGGLVIWIQNTTTGTRDNWSVVHDVMATPDRRDTRMAGMEVGSHGYALWPKMHARPEDIRLPKTRYSAFIQGSSDLEQVLQSRGIDTLVITGTVTNVCCESTARDAMMLNYRVAVVSDGTASYNDDFHASSLIALYRTFSDVLTTDQTLAALAASSGNALQATAAG
jgi:ureidoacrylate peracid hydrolase